VIYGFRHERIDKSVRFSNGRVYINGIEGFFKIFDVNIKLDNF